MTGVALLLPYCSYVDIVEYMPSTRLTSRCHYYDTEVSAHFANFAILELKLSMSRITRFLFVSQMDSACTFGAWHPLAAEKLMTYDMNSADEFTTFQNGIIRIRKPKSNGCN